jgi:hypothetical protein
MRFPSTSGTTRLPLIFSSSRRLALCEHYAVQTRCGVCPLQPRKRIHLLTLNWFYVCPKTHCSNQINASYRRSRIEVLVALQAYPSRSDFALILLLKVISRAKKKYYVYISGSSKPNSPNHWPRPRAVWCGILVLMHCHSLVKGLVRRREPILLL